MALVELGLEGEGGEDVFVFEGEELELEQSQKDPKNWLHCVSLCSASQLRRMEQIRKLFGKSVRSVAREAESTDVTLDGKSGSNRRWPVGPPQ